MATFVWELQDTNSGTTVIAATDILGFYGATFDTVIATGSYQDSIHVENVSNVEQCSTYHGVQNKWISSTNVDLGSGSVALTTVTDADCVLKIHFNHTSAVACTAVTFWAYDGTTTTAVPTDITFQCVESGETPWVNAEGSAAAATLANSGSAEDHYFYLVLSASPEDVGDLEEFELAIQLTYQ